MLQGSLLLEPPKNQQEVQEISHFNQVLNTDKIRICLPDERHIDLPVSVINYLKVIVDALASGQAVTLIPLDKELTTQQAADLLNVSRPFLVKIIEEGKIPYIKVGRHRRILMEDLLKYKAHRDKIRKETLQELTDLSQELGLYD